MDSLDHQVSWFSYFCSLFFNLKIQQMLSKRSITIQIGEVINTPLDAGHYELGTVVLDTAVSCQIMPYLVAQFLQNWLFIKKKKKKPQHISSHAYWEGLDIHFHTSSLQG